MSHVVAGATMAIVRVSVLAGASQVEPCAGSSFLFVSFPASFTCFVHSHTVKAEGGVVKESSAFSSFCERVPRCDESVSVHPAPSRVRRSLRDRVVRARAWSVL